MNSSTTTTSTSTSSSSRSFKDKIAMYEDPDNPLAPLSPGQREFILHLTHNPVEREVPKHLRDKKKREPRQEGEDNVQQFNTKHEFNEWFKKVEDNLASEQDVKVVEYLQNLEGTRAVFGNLLGQVTDTLEQLKMLEDNYHEVTDKTNALHNSCRQLIQEQETLERIAKELDANLEYFLNLEKMASKLSVPSMLVTSDAFFSILEQIDSCLSFLVHNPTFKESNTYAAKFKHCLNRALSMVKAEIHKALHETTNDVTQAVGKLQEEEKQTGDTPHTESLFPLIYGKFSAGIAKMKRAFTEIENRRNAWPEYTELFNEIQQSFLRERYNLLNPSVWDTVATLNAKGKMGVDLCSTVRMGCAFCINLCQDEFRLFGDFFQPSFATNFDEFAERLFTPVYESLRPLIIKIQHLETLAEMCTILRVEMLQDQALTNPQGLNSFISIVQQLLQDTQERLVYRAHIYISTDIRNYNAGPGDLAYPEKLEMMQQIADSIDHTVPAERPSLARSNSQTSLISLSSSIASEATTQQLQIPRPLKSSSSPADIHGMWFPSVRRTLLCLSKLHRCLDKAIFQGLSQEALIACIANVNQSAQVIAQRKTLVDGQLFEIKHLLILREQIAPFQAEFAVKETTLDFSRVKTAAWGLFHHKMQMFSLNSNNAVLEFIVEGTPQVREYFLDSKKEVDKQLKLTCEQFITHCTQILIGPMKNFINRASRIIEAMKEKPDLVLSQQSFALPNLLVQLVQETMESLKSKLPFIHRSMKLYLANRETEFILFRPVKNNVLNGFLQLDNIVASHYSSLGTPISCPTQDEINVLISSIMMLQAN